MTYEDEVTGERETIWNSRDGVTPFTITSRAGNPARHVDWNRDEFRPAYVPAVGDRVFVDLTRERARAIIEANVAKWWSDDAAGIRSQWPTPEAAVADLVEGHFRPIVGPDGEEHARREPDVVTVTPEMRDAFVASRAECAFLQADAAAEMDAKSRRLADEIKARERESRRAMREFERAAADAPPSSRFRDGQVVTVGTGGGRAVECVVDKVTPYGVRLSFLQ